MPKYYSYNPVTKALVGEGDAQVSPAEVGVYLLPAFATFKVPPVFNAATHTAVFDNVNWSVIPRPVQVIEEAVFGWLATDAEKQEILLKLANEFFMDMAAQAMGFTNIADAVASAPTGVPANQAERDALALKTWRMGVLSKINEWIALVQGNSNPMPPVKTIIDSLPKFVRVIPEPSTTPVLVPVITAEQIANPTSLNAILGLPPGQAEEATIPPFPHTPANP